MRRNSSRFLLRLFAAMAAISLFVSGLAVGDRRPAHALGLFAGPGTQPLGANGNSFHYYASGKRIDLTPSVNWVSVKFTDANPNAEVNALKGSGAPLSATGETRALPGNGWTLVPVTPGTTQAALVQGINAMRGMPAKFTAVNPVFQAGNDQMAVTDEFIAAFDSGESQAQIDATNAMYGVETVQPLLGQPNTFVLKVSADSHMDALAMANLYQDSSAALTAAPNFLRMTPTSNAPSAGPTTPLATPCTPTVNDYWYCDQWALKNTTQYPWMTPNVDIDAPDAWGVTTGSSTVKIAVVDSGVDSAQPDLSGKLVGGFDATGLGSGGSPCTAPCPNNDDARGTAMAGLAAASTGNTIGIAGVCRLCPIMPVRIGYSNTITGLWTTSDAWAASGIGWAWSNGASVIVSSFQWASPSGPLEAAISNAITLGRGGLGTVVVFAAGDNNSSVSYPANLSTVISVGALNLCNGRELPAGDACNGGPQSAYTSGTLWGSNYGPQLDIVAPGVTLDITDRIGTAGYNNGCSVGGGGSGDSGDYNFCFGGTAGAAAIVAGVTGLLLTVRPSLIAGDVKTILESTAVDVPPAGFDNDTGFGVVNANNAVRAATNVNIGGTLKGSYYIPGGSHMSPSYPGTFSGPVEVKDSLGANLVTSQRIIYQSSFSETLGFPNNQLTTDYWFPWYDFTGMSSWIVVGNTSGSQSANVEVWIAGVRVDSTTIAPNGRWTPAYVGTFNGPVEVKSTNGVNIFVTQRMLYGSSFTETLGFPANQLTTDYWFPWYDFTGMSSWIVVGNTSSSQAANVEVWIAGSKIDSTTIPINGRWTPAYPGTFNGPVEVKSTNAVNIFVSQRVLYKTSFTETLGFPAGRLTTDYWFPWYDFTGLSTWIVVGNTSSSQAANVEVWVAGSKIDSTTIPINGRWTPAYVGTSNGPVEVKSTNGVKIFVSERVLYNASFKETLGIPANQLTSDYWYSWYDYTGMASWIIIDKP